MQKCRITWKKFGSIKQKINCVELVVTGLLVIFEQNYKYEWHWMQISHELRFEIDDIYPKLHAGLKTAWAYHAQCPGFT